MKSLDKNKTKCEICGNKAEFILGHWICFEHFISWLDKFCK